MTIRILLIRSSPEGVKITGLFAFSSAENIALCGAVFLATDDAGQTGIALATALWTSLHSRPRPALSMFVAEALLFCPQPLVQTVLAESPRDTR